MPFTGDQKRSYNRETHRRKRLRRAGLVEQASERKVLFPIRIAEGIVARIHRLTHEGIAKGTHPWKTPSDMVRHLIMRGLESMKDDEPLVAEMVPYMELTRQFDALTSSRREAQASFNRATTEIQELLQIGAKQEALQYYHVTKAAAHEMPPTVWRNWLIDQLVQTFPQLDKQPAPGVGLTNGKLPERRRKDRRAR